MGGGLLFAICGLWFGCCALIVSVFCALLHVVDWLCFGGWFAGFVFFGIGLWLLELLLVVWIRLWVGLVVTCFISCDAGWVFACLLWVFGCVLVILFVVLVCGWSCGFGCFLVIMVVFVVLVVGLLFELVWVFCWWGCVLVVGLVVLVVGFWVLLVDEVLTVFGFGFDLGFGFWVWF